MVRSFLATGSQLADGLEDVLLDDTTSSGSAIDAFIDLSNMTGSVILKSVQYNSGSLYQDDTTAAGTTGNTTVFAILSGSGASAMYFGFSGSQFSGVTMTLSSTGSVPGVVWQYSTGSGGYYPLSGVSDGTAIGAQPLARNGSVTWTIPTSPAWTTDTIGNNTGSYFVRVTGSAGATGTYATYIVTVPDTTAIRVYIRDQSGSALTELYYMKFSGYQLNEANYQTPMIYVPAVTEPYEYKLTLQQTQGIYRTYTWSALKG